MHDAWVTIRPLIRARAVAAPRHEDRPGFLAMLSRIADNGVRCILVKTTNRFARDLVVQETGWRFLQAKGIELVAADSPEAFLSDTPTAVLVRQELGAVSQFEKASLVAKLAAARRRQRRRTGKCEGRKGYRETHPALVEQARSLRREGQTLAQVAAALAVQGMVAGSGRPFAPAQIARLLTAEDSRIGKQRRRQPTPSEAAPLPHHSYRQPGTRQG